MAKREKIKTRQFEIPKNFIGAFFNQLEETELNYELIEIDEDHNDLIIEVEYSSDDREDVMNLIELLDEYLDEEQEELEEEENS